MSRRPRSRRVLAAASVLTVPLLAAPLAGAQTTTAPAPAPAPAPVKTTLKLSTESTPKQTVLQGDRWRALVVLGTPVPGAKAVVTFTAKGRKTVTKTVDLAPSKKGDRGVARVTYKSASARRVVVRASLVKGTAATVANPKAAVVTQARASARSGSKGYAVRRLQSMLRAKGYVAGKSGRMDGRTARAVLAYRKVTGMARTQQANRAVFRGLQAGKGAFKVKFPSHGRHIEGSISKQVVALIGKGGKVEAIYPTSSGKGSTPTIRGTFRVYRKDAGTNSLGMLDAVYFIRGYAVHGYPSVPTYPASHGCFRIPNADARTVFNWSRMGTIVDSY